MKALAALPHVSTKLSGFGFVHRRWTEEQIQPLILEAIEIFGTDRCMFASDVPTDKLFGSLEMPAEIGSYVERLSARPALQRAEARDQELATARST